jgi:aspartyl protease family protein
MSRILLVLLVLAATAGAVVAYGDPDRIARAGDTVAELLHRRVTPAGRFVRVARGDTGEFALQAKINGVNAPMVIDTGATSVVLTHETAKALGLPLELLEYDVDVETAGGHTKAARLTLHRQTRRAFDPGARGAARTDEDQPARHEFSGPAGKLGSPRRPPDAARVSLRGR